MGQCLCRWGKDRREVVYPFIEVNDALLLLQAGDELTGALRDEHTVIFDRSRGEGAGPRAAPAEVDIGVLKADHGGRAIIEQFANDFWEA